MKAIRKKAFTFLVRNNFATARHKSSHDLRYLQSILHKDTNNINIFCIVRLARPERSSSLHCDWDQGQQQ